MLDTPVLLLVFNRPDTTRRVFEAIRQAKPRQLFIAADGPRPGRPDDAARCAEVRAVVGHVDWDCEVKTLFRDHNLGCGVAPAGSITWFFEQVEHGIILEDDCLPEPSFFPFCGELLHHYRHHDNVMMISGNNFQPKSRGEGSYYFSRYGHTWGWATWRRAWQHYDFNIPAFDAVSTQAPFRATFQTEAEFQFWRKTFDEVKHGRRKDIWDYQWFFCIRARGGISIVPNVNLVSNVGFGQDATHTYNADPNVANRQVQPLHRISHPRTIRVDEKADYITYRTVHNAPASLMNVCRSLSYKYLPAWLVTFLQVYRRKLLPSGE
jgi:hypothetical protein